MEKQKLIELLRKAYLSGIMEKGLADKMQGFKHDFESMATHYAEIEVNNIVLDDVSDSEKITIPKKEYEWLKKCEKDLNSIDFSL